MAHWIDVSDYCTDITSRPIVVIVAPTTTVESMSPITVLLELMTEPLLPNRYLRSTVIYIYIYYAEK